MSQMRDDMIERALGEISKTNDEGISISLLFERLESSLSKEPAAKDLVWQSLVARGDILLGDAKTSLALRKLALEDVLALGLGSKTIKFQSSPEGGRPSHGRVGVENAQATIPAIAPVIPDASNPSIITTPTQGNGPAPKNSSQVLESISTPTPTPTQTPKRGRGRPPNITPRPATLAAQPITQLPKRRGRPPKAKPNLITPTASTTVHVNERHETAVHLAPIGFPEKDPNGLIKPAIVENSTIFTDHDGNSPADISHALEPQGISPDYTGVVEPTSIQDASKDTRLRPKRVTRPKNAVFTSWEDIQRHAGVAGVYIEHDMSHRRRAENNFYGAKSIVLVFKSDELKSAQWLATHKNNWVEPLAAKMAQTVIQKEDTAQTSPSKREKAGADLQSLESVIGPNLKRKRPSKPAKPGADLSKTAAQPGIDAEETSKKRKRTPSISQLSSQSEGAPSKKRGHKSKSPVTRADYSPEHATSMPGIHQTPRVSPIHDFVLGNKPPETSTLQPQTFFKRSFDPKDSPHQLPNTVVQVGGPVQIPTPQYQRHVSPHQSILKNVASWDHLSQNGAYRSPYASSVEQPISLDAQRHTTVQNVQANRSPCDQGAIDYSHAPVHWTGGAQLYKAPESYAGNMISQVSNRATQKSMGNENGTQKEFFSSSTLSSREEPSRSFNSGLVSPNQLRQPVSVTNPNSQKGESSSHLVKSLEISEDPSNSENSAQRNSVEAALLQATSIPVPSHIVRLAAIYRDAIGNLLLSSDKSTLEFFGLDQDPLQAPIISLPISSMDLNPITSVSGSYPMEIRISSSKDGVSSTYSFQFASTPEAYEAAGNMRAKLVTAKIAFQFRTGEQYHSPAEAEQDKIRPYKCDKCRSTFKNKGGLEYHLTRSQTTCNPKYDHSQVKPRTPRVKKRQSKTVIGLAPPISENELSPSKQRSFLGAQPKLSRAKERTRGTSSDSDDSILEWAEQHATSGLAPVYQQPSMFPPAPALSKYTRRGVPLRSLPGEAPLWQEITQEVLPNECIAARPHLEMAKEQYFQKITLDLVNENEGLFPGDKGLWFGVVGAWLKRDDKSSNSIPDSKVCRMAFEDLLGTGKLQVSEFTFRDKGSRVVTRNIVAAPGLDPQSMQFGLMKVAIKEAYPEFYVPTKYAPPDTILSRLQSIARHLFRPTKHQVEVGGVDRNASPPRRVPSSSNDEFVAEEAMLEQEDSFEEDGGASDEDGDEFKPWLTDNKRNQKTRRPVREIRRRWTPARASGTSTLSKGARQVTQARKRVTIQRVISVGLHGWMLPMARLPNPETGAWDQDPIIFKQRAPPNHRARLPEPITYIQAPNGAWAERAFGHGVNPIFSRRPRRVEKFSTSANQYRRRLDNGFRPILYRGKDKHHLSAVPSRDSLSSSVARSQPDNFSLDLEGSIEPDEVEYEPPAFEEDEYSDGPQPKIRTPKSTSRSARTRSSRTSRLASASRKPGLIDDGLLGLLELPRPSQLGRRMRTSTKAAEALDKIETLSTFEPKETGVGASINPGLRTLPIYFGLGGSVLQEEEHQASENLKGYQQAQFLDSKAISQSSDFGEGSWTYYGKQTSAKSQLKWRENTAFTVENLPYNELETDDENIDHPRRPRARVQKKRRIESRSVSLSNNDYGEEKFSKIRTQTAIPADFEGVLLDTVMHPTSTFEIEVANSPIEFHRGQARQMPINMTPELERRFVAAVISVQILTGGLEGNIDWVLITNIFSDFSTQFLMKTWGQLRTKMPDIVEHIAEDFRDAFPGAYERGEVPPINFGNLTSYNWNPLLDWVTTTINPTLNAQSVILPAARKELNQQYLITESIGEVNNWRDSYFGLSTAIYKRIDMAAAVATTVPVRHQGEAMKYNGIEINNLALAKSWVRAAAITPEENWDQKKAGAKLKKLGLPLVEDALQALLEAKVLVHRSKGRALPGRSYEASDAFAAPLRKHITNQQFIDALNFKRLLDEEFSRGEGGNVTVDYMASDGALMCITSLQAHGRIELHGVDVPMNKFGLTGGGYETKKIPREKLRFRIDIHPTSSYVFSHDSELLRRIEYVEPPRAGEQGELPAWIGITGEPIEDLWKRVLASVSQVVTLRAGITLDPLKKAFAPTLEEWELKRFMEWGVQLGIFERLHKNVEGWTAAEWWWLAVARLCEK